MNILLVNNYWYIRGGAERVLFATKDMLEQAGHAVSVFGMHHPDNVVTDGYFVAQTDFDNISLWDVRKSIYNHEAKKLFVRCVDETEPDIIHAHNIYHHISFSICDVIRDADIPSVITMHDYKLISPQYRMFHHGHVDRSIMRSNYMRCLLSNCMESFPKSLVATQEALIRKQKKLDEVFSAYISPSKFLVDLATEAGLDASRLHHISNPYSGETSSTSPGDAVTFVGRLVEEKGPHLVLDAAKQLSTIPFRIVGDGPMRAQLEERVRKEKIKNCTFTGHLTGADLERALERARFVLVPSIWYENAPLAIIEAGAKGRVVLGSEIGGIPEMIPATMQFAAGDVDALARTVKRWWKKSDSQLQTAAATLQKRLMKIHDPEQYGHALEQIYRAIV